MSDVILDLRGLKCPMPVLRTRKALGRLGSGETMLVQCTDPMAAIDLPHLLRQTGDELIGRSVDGEVLSFRIQRSPQREPPA